MTGDCCTPSCQNCSARPLGAAPRGRQSLWTKPPDDLIYLHNVNPIYIVSNCYKKRVKLDQFLGRRVPASVSATPRDVLFSLIPVPEQSHGNEPFIKAIILQQLHCATMRGQCDKVKHSLNRQSHPNCKYAIDPICFWHHNCMNRPRREGYFVTTWVTHPFTSIPAAPASLWPLKTYG